MSADLAFLDTVGLLALWDEDDQWHDAAESAYTELRRGRVRGVTTGYVLIECANAAARRPYRDEVARLREWLEGHGLVLWPADEEWAGAWRDYSRRGPGGPGVVDLISFSIMRRLKLTRAFTNDKHFRAEGFLTLF